MSDIETRLARLESQNVALRKLLLFGPLLILVAGLALGWKLRSDDLQGKSVRIVDDAGVVHAVMDQNGLIFFEDGKPRSILGIHEDQPGLAFLTPEGKPSMVLSTIKDGGGVFGFYDSTDALRAAIALQENNAAVTLKAGKGKEGLVLATTNTGSVLQFADDADHQRMSISALHDQPSSVLIGDESGKPRISLQATKSQQAISILGEDGKAVKVVASNGGE